MKVLLLTLGICAISINAFAADCPKEFAQASKFRGYLADLVSEERIEHNDFFTLATATSGLEYVVRNSNSGCDYMTNGLKNIEATLNKLVK
jgi:hypothetical protein